MCNQAHEVKRTYWYLHYVLHHSRNNDSKLAYGVVVHIHHSTDKSILQIKPVFRYNEACLVETNLRSCKCQVSGMGLFAENSLWLWAGDFFLGRLGLGHLCGFWVCLCVSMTKQFYR